MAVFGLRLEKTPTGKAKCQLCQKPIPKEGKAIYIHHYFSGDRGYIHDYCIATLLDELHIPDKKEEAS